MQESTKNPSFIPATHFYNDFKRLYNAKGNTRKQAKAIRYSSPGTSYAYLYCIFLVYFCHSTTNYRKYANLYVFSWRFHIFIVILQSQTNKNTAYESKEQ